MREESIHPSIPSMEPTGFSPVTSCVQADRFVHSCLMVSRKYLQIRHFCWPREDRKGRRETNWCPPGGPSAFVTWGGGKRAAAACRLRQLEDAAAAKAALASAIAVCASSRGISSNSSITWP